MDPVILALVVLVVLAAVALAYVATLYVGQTATEQDASGLASAQTLVPDSRSLVVCGLAKNIMRVWPRLELFLRRLKLRRTQTFTAGSCT